MGTFKEDNADGITIIDVTDPEVPSYCFLFFHARYDSAVPLQIPVSAEQYVRHYDPAPNGLSDDEGNNSAIELDVLSTIHAFASIPMISQQKIAEAWPEEYGRPKYRAGKYLLQPTEEVSHPEATTLSTGLPSLVDLTFGPAVEVAIRNNDRETLEFLFSLPGRSERSRKSSALNSHCLK
ncbi:hypothetical protein BDZ97DRAFT_715631 [Flammula alnicola]|nr:hypothetical protein BDZ97DRAFT_715631 [Flammula alnicola]